MARSLIDIVALDLLLEGQLAKHASLKDFKLVVCAKNQMQRAAIGMRGSIACVAIVRVTPAGGT